MSVASERKKEVVHTWYGWVARICPNPPRCHGDYKDQ